MVPFGNKGMVLHQIYELVKVGVDHIVLAVNYRAEVMEDFLRKYEKELGIKISISQETEPLGTAGPLALARELLDGTEPFFVLNSDIICKFPFEKMVAFHKAHGKEGTIAVTKVEDPSKYGVIVSDTHGEIIQFVEKPSVFVSNRINAGIYLFNPSILERIELKPTSIEKEIFPKMAHNNQLYCIDLDGFWMDVGQPKDYLAGMCLYLTHLRETQPDMLAKGEGIVGDVLIDPTAKIGANCTIGPHVVIGKNVVIQDGCRVKKTTLMDGVVIKAHAWVNNSIVGWNSTVGKWARLDGVSVLGEDVTVGDELYVNGGKVLPHKSISANIPAPEIIM
eukprot:comp19138_c0_seq1/m.21792 comp19138_c0_seq1/g.21792  ORF comp19138_c0_seq1/g.21792 comp19138_c0_seq1/m.21792 type:complete len:335 (-) comp19138_c0_seq1:202-1206(-)